MGQSLDRIKQRHSSLQNFGEGGNAIEYFKPKAGANRIRIIPPFAEREDFWIERKIRWGVGPNNKKIFSPLDPSAPDPAKVEYERLKALDDDASKKRAHDMREKKRALFWIIDRGEPEKGAQLWDTNLYVLRDILAIFMDSDYGDITDAEKGVDIVVNYTPGSSNSFPQWQIVPKRDSTGLGHPEFLKEDLFEKFRIGNPSDADYVEACLDGTEKAFVEAKRAERESSAPAEINETPSPAPLSSEEEAVKKELERIKLKQVATAPPPVKTTAETPANLLDATWWVSKDGKTLSAGGKEIQALVDAGTPVQVCHAEITGNAWKKAADVGFVAAAAPPPPPSQVSQDLEAALG